MSRDDLVAEVAAEVQEEGEELARAAVDALFRDGVLMLDGPYVRCAYVQELLAVFALLLGPGPWLEELGTEVEDQAGFANDAAELIIWREG